MAPYAVALVAVFGVVGVFELIAIPVALCLAWSGDRENLVSGPALEEQR